jgi:hypothetical protein
MSAYTHHGKTKAAKKNSGGKINTDRKRSSYTEKDCFEKSQNYCSTGDSRTDIHLEDPVSTTSDVSFTNPTSTVGLQLLDLCLLKVILRYVNDAVTTIKPGNQTTRQPETRA